MLPMTTMANYSSALGQPLPMMSQQGAPPLNYSPMPQNQAPPPGPLYSPMPPQVTAVPQGQQMSMMPQAPAPAPAPSGTTQFPGEGGFGAPVGEGPLMSEQTAPPPVNARYDQGQSAEWGSPKPQPAQQPRKQAAALGGGQEGGTAGGMDSFQQQRYSAQTAAGFNPRVDLKQGEDASAAWATGGPLEAPAVVGPSELRQAMGDAVFQDRVNQSAEQQALEDQAVDRHKKEADQYSADAKTATDKDKNDKKKESDEYKKLGAGAAGAILGGIMGAIGSQPTREYMSVRHPTAGPDMSGALAALQQGGNAYGNWGK